LKCQAGGLREGFYCQKGRDLVLQGIMEGVKGGGCLQNEAGGTEEEEVGVGQGEVVQVIGTVPAPMIDTVLTLETGLNGAILQVVPKISHLHLKRKENL